jgi:hypothetical protein
MWASPRRSYRGTVSSAPEHADAISNLCAPLSQAKRDELAYRWIDRCVRVHAADAVERAGYPRDAERLRALAELRGRAECADACKVLAAATASIPGDTAETMEIVACLFCLMTVEGDLHDTGTDFRGVIICTVTAARCAGAWNEEPGQIADVNNLLA